MLPCPAGSIRPSSPLLVSSSQPDEQQTAAVADSSHLASSVECGLISAQQRQFRYWTASPVSRVTPDFQPPGASSPVLRAGTAPCASKRPAEAADDSYAADHQKLPHSHAGTAAGCIDFCSHQLQECSQLPGDARQLLLSTPTGTADSRDSSPAQQTASWLAYDPSDGPSQQKVEGAYLAAAAGRISNTDAADVRPGSPSWLLKAATAGRHFRPATVKAESSLYSNWATTYSSEGGGTSGGPLAAPGKAAVAAVPNVSHADAVQPCAGADSSAVATVAADQSRLQSTLGALSGSTGAQAADVAAGSCWPSLPPHTTTADNRPSSPTDMRRAAAAVAGIGKAGMNTKYQGWLKEQFPGVRPPRREDAESLRQWLEQQLLQLHHQVQQQSLGGGRMAQHEQRQQDQVHGVNIATFTGVGELNSSTARWRSTSPVATRRPPPSAPATAAQLASATGTTSAYTVDQTWLQTGLEVQTSQLLLLAQGPEGALIIDELQQLEAVYSAAFHELCR